eukprot:759865-Amphidinium_carterae.1
MDAHFRTSPLLGVFEQLCSTICTTNTVPFQCKSKRLRPQWHTRLYGYSVQEQFLRGSAKYRTQPDITVVMDTALGSTSISSISLTNLGA